MAPFGMLLGVILGSNFDQILILFLNPQNRGFAIPSHTFRYSGITKAIFLGPLFNHFFDPILGPPFEEPFEEPFGPPWPQKVPTLPPHVDFETFLGSPLGSKMGPWSAHGRPRGAKRLVPRARFEVPFPSWTRPVFQRGPASHPYRFWDPLGWPSRLFGSPRVT